MTIDKNNFMSSDGGGGGGGGNGGGVVDPLGDSWMNFDVPFPNDKMGRQLESMLHQFLTQVLKHHFSKSSSTTTTTGGEQEENVENDKNDKNDENEKMDEENGENDENDDENDSSSIPLDMNVISSMIDTIQFDTLPLVSTTSLFLICL